ncbi:MAG: ornithine cyclodeaminase family protein [Nakamurella sp.]
MTSPTTLLLSGDDVLAMLTPDEVLASQEAAFRLTGHPELFRSGQLHYTGVAGDSLAFAHGALAHGRTGFVFKSGVQCPGNSLMGLPTVHATVTVHDPDSGEVLGLLNGAAVTALRTAGGVAAAFRRLIGAGSTRLGVFGSGVQALELVRLVCAVLPIEQCLVWSPRLCGRAGVLDDPAWEGLPVSIARSPQSLCENSNAIATCTTSAVPVLSGEWLQPGTTVATMGSYLPELCEIDLTASGRADVTVLDSRGALTAVGPVMAAVAAGRLAVADTVILGDVLDGTTTGRVSSEQIVVFHSNGLGLQDATLAWAIYSRAADSGRGTRVHL